MARCQYNLLRAKTTAFESSQRGYLGPEGTTIRCGQRPQHLKIPGNSVCGSKDHNTTTCKPKSMNMFVIMPQYPPPTDASKEPPIDGTKNPSTDGQKESSIGGQKESSTDDQKESSIGGPKVSSTDGTY